MQIFSLLLSLFVIADKNGFNAMGPLIVGERNPLYLLFFDLQPDSTDLVPQRKVSVAFACSYSNIFEVKSNDSWVQELDMENLITDLDVRYGLRTNLEVGFRVFLQSSSNGFLDSYIQDFHEFFGFPNGSRGNRADNQYSFLLQQLNGSLQINTEPQTMSLTSEYFFVRFPVWKEKNFPIILKLTLKNSAENFGFDLDPVTAMEFSNTFFSHKWGIHSHFGYVDLNPTDEFQALTNSGSFFLSESFEYYYRGISLFAQISSATAFFGGTGLSTLDEKPVNFSTGIGGHTKKTEWQVSFTEDISFSGPSVDFSLNLRIKNRF